MLQSMPKRKYVSVTLLFECYNEVQTLHTRYTQTEGVLYLMVNINLDRERRKRSFSDSTTIENESQNSNKCQ